MCMPRSNRILAVICALFVCAIPIPLEASDLLVGDRDNGAALRYAETTPTSFTQAGGNIAVNPTLGAIQGVAVAPDKTVYVSTNLGQVLHYNLAGTLLGTLGSGDTTKASFFSPGTLAFGPNGHLYVADLGNFSDKPGQVFQFDTTSSTQQYLVANTLTVNYPVGGFTFASNGELIVGDLAFGGAITQYHANGSVAATIVPALGYNVSSMVREANGDILFTDIDFVDSANHHQVLIYDPNSAAPNHVSQFINLTSPTFNNGDFTALPQASTLLVDTDGNLLVALGPHSGNNSGEVQKYNITSGASMGTVVTGIGSPAGMALIPEPSTWILAATGALALALAARRRANRGGKHA